MKNITAPQAAARLAREKKVLIRKHKVMVDILKDISTNRRAVHSVFMRMLPTWGCKQKNLWMSPKGRLLFVEFKLDALNGVGLSREPFQVATLWFKRVRGTNTKEGNSK